MIVQIQFVLRKVQIVFDTESFFIRENLLHENAFLHETFNHVTSPSVHVKIYDRFNYSHLSKFWRYFHIKLLFTSLRFSFQVQYIVNFRWDISKIKATITIFSPIYIT